MSNYFPSKDNDFANWLATFLTNATANLTALGLLATEMTALSLDKTNFDSSMTDLENKKAVMKAATQTKDTNRTTAITYVRTLVRRIQASVTVSNTLKAELQITVPGSTPAPPLVPYPPTNLVANVISSNSNELTWERNGNSGNILFVVFAELPGATSLIQITTTSKTTFTHTGNPPGTRIVYQVCAKRGETLSPPSNVAVVNEHVV